MDDRELAGTLAKIINNQMILDTKVQCLLDAVIMKDESLVKKESEEKKPSIKKEIEEEKPVKKEEFIDTDYDDGLSDSDYE